METPNPTPQELDEADSLVNGDIGAAQDELIRRLQALLPARIEAKNAARGWTGAADKIPALQGFAPAPTVLGDAYIGTLVVGMGIETTPQGIGGTFRNEATVTISSIDGRTQSAAQIRAGWARAEAIRACLYPFLSGCINPQGIAVWRLLEPTGFGLLTGDWAQGYGGTSITYRLLQSPGNSNYGF